MTDNSNVIATVGALNFATVAVYADLYITQPILPLLSKEFQRNSTSRPRRRD